MVNIIPPAAQHTFEDILKTNGEVLTLREQKSQHEQSLKMVTDIIKEYKAKRTKKLSLIVGGNLMLEKDSQWAVKHLMERKQQMTLSLKSITEQVERREDILEGLLIKGYRTLNNIVPEDIKDGSGDRKSN